MESICSAWELAKQMCMKFPSPWQTCIEQQTCLCICSNAADHLHNWTANSFQLLPDCCCLDHSCASTPPLYASEVQCLSYVSFAQLSGRSTLETGATREDLAGPTNTAVEATLWGSSRSSRKSEHSNLGRKRIEADSKAQEEMNEIV